MGGLGGIKMNWMITTKDQAVIYVYDFSHKCIILFFYEKGGYIIYRGLRER